MDNILRNKWLLADYDIFLKDCESFEYQASGHGGQKVNRKYSAIKVVHIPTKLSAYSSDTRSQNLNKQHSVNKIKFLIALKIRMQNIEDIIDFMELNKPNSIKSFREAIWIAIVLDLLTEFQFDNKKVAEIIGISVSQLIKILYDNKIIWQLVNNNRLRLGMNKLFSSKKR
jgi:hypothetical protein